MQESHHCCAWWESQFKSFFLIEEVKQKKFRVYDNLRGHTWIKRSEIGKKHKVYGFVLCARKRTPSTFSFDPSIYANVAKPTNDDVVKVNTRGHSKATNSQRVKGRMQIGVRLSAYRQGIAAKLNHKKKISDQHCGMSSGKRDQMGRRSQKPAKEKSCISDTFHKLSLSPKEKKQSSDDVTNIHSEHVSKKSKNDVNMERETLSPIGVISLFDGVSSVLPITDILGRPPTIFVGAENDQTLRHLVAEKFGFRLDGKWKKHSSGMCSIYLDDVKKLFANNCQLFSEIISIAGTECKWVLVAGSPCQDFTFAGFSGGLLGLCGPQSSLFFYVHLAIWYLQENYPAGYVRFLVENAGSMQIIHKRAIKEILNIQQCTDDQLRWDSADYFGIKRDRFFFRNFHDTDNVFIADHTISGVDGFGPLLNTSCNGVPIGPLLRVREDMGGVLRLSWTAYQPVALLWDYNYWGGKEQFATKANLKGNARIPALDFTKSLPPLWRARWVEFLQNAYKTGLSGTKKDELVLRIMPFFHNEDVFIPFRILTPTEVQKFAGLTGFFSDIRVNLPLLTERVIRDYCGNSFHPALIRAALGSRDDFARWLSSLTPDDKHDAVATPAKTRAIYHRVSDEIRTKAVQEHRADIIQQSIGNDPMPDVTISQLPSLVKDQVPVISTQSTFPVPATRQMVQDLVKPKNVCGPFSAAAKIVVQKFQYPINILEQSFFGSGCFCTDEIVDFFFGHNAVQHTNDVEKAKYNGLRTLQDKFTQTGQGLEKLLVEIMQNVIRKGVQVQIVFIVDLQAQTIFKRIGVKCPQWVTYCVWDPVKKYFYLDTAAWSAYGPIPRNWGVLPELMYVPVAYEARSFSVSYPIVYDGIHKCQILLSGQATAFVSKYCPLCNREADIGLTCPVHSQQYVAPQLLRAVAIVDNELNFRVVQSKSADRDNHAPCWRVLVVSSNFEQHLNQLIEPSFQFTDSPTSICIGTSDTGISLRYHVSRFRNFEEIWRIFCAGDDNYIDEWNEPVVAHIWNFATYHDLST